MDCHVQLSEFSYKWFAIWSATCSYINYHTHILVEKRVPNVVIRIKIYMVCKTMECKLRLTARILLLMSFVLYHYWSKRHQGIRQQKGFHYLIRSVLQSYSLYKCPTRCQSLGALVIIINKFHIFATELRQLGHLSYRKIEFQFTVDNILVYMFVYI